MSSLVQLLLRSLVCLGLAFVLVSPAHASPAQASPAPAPASDPRQLWQLLDYVGVDYREAVADGRVVDDGEYAEMRDFTVRAQALAQGLPGHPGNPGVLAAIERLRGAVWRKAAPAEVAHLAREANALLVAAHPIDRAPAATPDLKIGEAIYRQQCASCHGERGGGDGPAGRHLDPAPIAFTDGQRAASRSLMALYQATTQGVRGTGMPAFAHLSEQERWSVAFHVGTLAGDKEAVERGRALWQSDDRLRRTVPDLATLVSVTEDRMTPDANASESESASGARDLLAFLRRHPETLAAPAPHAGFDLARQRLAASLAALEAGQKAQATGLALSAYLDGFEPMEAALSAADGALVLRIEDAMLAHRHAIDRGDLPRARDTAHVLSALLDDAQQTLQRRSGDFMTAFFGALTLLTREGVEALLIVIGMLAFLRKSNQPQAVRSVHAGWVAALAAGLATWVAATYLVSISGASREVTEGLSSLFAAAVLLGVGLWMHHQSAAGRWQAYLRERLTSALTQRSRWALFGLAFIAVYREVFETVLFFSALSADGHVAGLAAGSAVAVGMLAVIAWVLLKTSTRMPIGTFFRASAVLVALLAVVLMGKGVAGLQEAGWIAASPVDLPRLSLIGLYPTWQTVLAQGALLAVAVAGFLRNHVRAPRAAAA